MHQDHLDGECQEIGFKQGEVSDQEDVPKGRVHTETTPLQNKAEEKAYT